jgi:hypothetical protein
MTLGRSARWHRPSSLATTVVTPVIAAAAVALTLAQQVTRDARSNVAAGTATLSGRLVTDDQTPQPVRRARVELAADGPPLQTITDANGNFAFTKIAAGRYTLTATKPGYLRAAYGAKRSDRPGTPITVADAQQLSNITLTMGRGSVITGMVRDEMGQPAPTVSVRVLQYRRQNGEMTLSPVMSVSPIGQMTDDRGVYRIFALPPGEYVVVAVPRPLGGGDARQVTTAQMQSIQRLLQQPGGSSALPPVPPAPTVNYAPVFYPGSMSASSASAVTLVAGEERTGIDISLQLVKTAHVEGTVVAPAGVPVQSAQLYMTPAGPSVIGVVGISLNRTSPGPDGHFSYAGVTPGQYTISARLGGQTAVRTTSGDMLMTTRAVGGGGRNEASTGSLWANADVTVNGEDIGGLALNLQPGLTMSGRVVVQAANSESPGDLSRATITVQPSSSGVTIGTPAAQVDAAGHFTVTDLTPGKYTMSGQLPGSGGTSWTLKSVVVNGSDVLDTGLEIAAAERPSDALVTFTNQTQVVSGTLSDPSGRAAPDFTIVVFPADNRYWSASRRIKTSRPGTDGRFIINGLPAGEYRIAALVDIGPGDANDPSFLEQLVPASITFSLADGERKVQDIRMARVALAPDPPSTASRRLPRR